MGGLFDALPEAVARAARMASVPAALRALFANLPERIDLDVEVGAEAPSTTACQLLKLASLGGALRAGDVRIGDAARFVFRAGERRSEVPSLDAPIQLVCRHALEAVLDPAAFTRALEAFAAQSARLGALQTLTRHMLLAEDIDQALGAMLAGITSGAGLGFHRAAIFVRDAASDAYVGAKAIGPHDEREAHRIWEAIEIEEKSFDEQLTDSVRARVDARLEGVVKAMSLAPGDRHGDEIAAALALGAPVIFTAPRVNAELARLGAMHEVVLAPISCRGEVRALLFVDDAFGSAPIDRARLEFLGFFIDQVALVWDNLSLLRRVEQLARYDELTGLFNRRGFEERFHEEQSRATRAGESCALLLIDLDHFKAINDARGHAAGDEVLRKVGDVLRRGLREHDTAARHGGDELAVLLPRTTRDEALAVATRVGAEAREAGISLSIGGAIWPDDCAHPSKLLSVADGRLYEAKRWRGRASFGEGTIVEL